jgi:DNA-binding NarL/FixJ family response regulator
MPTTLRAAAVALPGDRRAQHPVLVSPDEVRVLIADGQPVVRAGFRAVLDGQHDLAVAGAAATFEELVALIRELRPDVVLLDLELPDVGGLEATRRILDDPMGAGIKVMILAAHDDDDDLFAALRTGARGFLLKSTEPIDLVRAVRVVARHAAADRRVRLPPPAAAPKPGTARRADRARA